LDPYSISLILAFTAIYVYALWRGVRGDERVRIYGPAVLVRCKKCIKVMDLLAKLRIPLLGTTALAFWAALVAVGTTLLVQSAIASFSLPPELAPEPRMLVGIPVVNPLIPLWYGLTGLIVAVVVHELSHGVALRVHGLDVKSTGLLLMVLPLGAFVEPGEELKRAKLVVQLKVFAAGPFANTLLAILVMSMLPLALAGVRPVAAGVGVVGVLPNSPAERAGLKPGVIITSIDGVRVESLDEFLKLMSGKKAGERVILELHDGVKVDLILDDKYRYTGDLKDRGKGFIGVALLEPRVLENALSPLLNPLADPLRTLWGLLAIPLTLPVHALPYLEAFYTPPLGGWQLTYTLVWIAWMNVAVGLTNALPMVPFDGGNATRVVLDAILQRMPEEERRKAVNAILAVLTALIVVLILIPVVVPRLR